MRYLSPFISLTSLGVTPSRVISVAGEDRISFFLIAQLYFIVCIHTTSSLPIHPSGDIISRHGAVRNNAAVNAGVPIISLRQWFHLFWRYSEVVLLDHLVVLEFLEGAPCCFSNCAGLHPHHQCTGLSFCSVSSLALVLSHVLHGSHPNTGEVTPHCGFDLHFPWWLVISSTLSCSCWPSVCFLWKDVSLGPLPVFFFFLFCYWVEWVPCVFWILTSCQIYDFQILSPGPQDAFSLCWLFSLLWRSPFSLM